MDIWEIIAAILTILAVTLSFYEIICHLLNFNKPYLQRYIIRILLIVPIYSMNAYIAMMIPSAGLYLDSLREVYESFVIYSFMKYLMNFLHYDTNLQQYIDHKPAPAHIIPFCCLPNCVGGKSFLLRCKHGILQYVVIRPITTLIAFISQIFGFYGEQNFIPFSGYTYPVLLIINNLSQLTAMYCLVIFYSGYKQELRPLKPLAKFLSIKLVVFFSFFQSIVISGLMEVEFFETTVRGWFPDLSDKILVSRKLQEFLICIDMLIAAIGHLIAFSYKPYVEDDENSTVLDGTQHGGDNSSQNSSFACCRALCNILDFSDEKNDVNEHILQIGSRVKQLFKRRPALPSVVSSGYLVESYGLDYDNIVCSKNPIEELPANHTSMKNGRTNQSPNKNYQSIE